MKKKRKKKSKIAIIVNGILTGLLLIFLAGNIYVNQSFAGVRNEKAELLEEKEALEEQMTKLQTSGEELKKQIEQETAKLEEKVSSEDAKTEDAENKTAENETAKQKENQTEAKELSGMKDVISSRISGRTGAGENWAVYVKRLSDGAEASVGEGKMTAASLIKLYIMGAVYENYEAITSVNGKDQVDRLLASMITVSDNDASNTLTKMLGKGDKEAGKAAVNDYCSKNGYADSSMGRMLLETNTDKENYTSVKDCGMFLERVYSNSISHAGDMLSLLKQQQRTGKIPAGVPSGVETANKTGELSNVENDAAIIFAEGKPYILCVMSEKLQNPAGARQTIVNLSSDVYGQINK